MRDWDDNLFAQLESGEGVDNSLKTEVTNKYVNWYKYNPTQQLHDSLTAEAIQMKSPDMYYVRREFVNIDKILGEDRESKFTKSWKIAAYIDSYANYEGQRDFYSKFGMMSNDEMTLVINPRLFAHQTDGGIPVLGDLIYFPMDNSLFEITWIEFDPFFQFGDRPQRKINLVKFIYTGEELDPKLQRNEGINLAPDADLDLEPIRNLDGLADTNIEQYEEDQAFEDEGDEFIESFDVVNGRGSPFAQFP
ncbi:head closure Hc2 [Escherichia phage phT4A]|uniref:Head completion, neck hetero-dimeric protein n=1 Tax=Escherichia phage phT4A TaxID=1852638 RepID=A0A193GZM2_9CAUD|nr:head closure Hc2 [Escherichia phage phT4A]ANN86464.1 head completion, neck hetero-dimeric protein [Escherichia phage phT4A]